MWLMPLRTNCSTRLYIEPPRLRRWLPRSTFFGERPIDHVGVVPRTLVDDEPLLGRARGPAIAGILIVVNWERLEADPCVSNGPWTTNLSDPTALVGSPLFVSRSATRVGEIEIDHYRRSLNICHKKHKAAQPEKGEQQRKRPLPVVVLVVLCGLRHVFWKPRNRYFWVRLSFSRGTRMSIAVGKRRVVLVVEDEPAASRADASRSGGSARS
jgi:hypothetical protein